MRRAIRLLAIAVVVLTDARWVNAQEAAAFDELAKLTATEVVRSSPAGEGVTGQVVVKPGDDWWLPERVQWSRHGSVICGYGEPWGQEKNWVCSGQAVWCPWKALQTEPGKLNSDGLQKYLERHGKAAVPAGKRPKEIQIYIHGTDCGAWSPEFLANPPFNVPTYEKLVAGNTTLKPDVLKIWMDGWTGVLKWAYPFWHPTYIEQRLAFHKLLADFLAQHPYGDRVSTIDLMGEFATLWMYVKFGLVPLSTVDEVAEPFVRSALDAGIPAEKWLIPLGVGGRAYRRFAALALKHRTGIGNHGAGGIIPFQFAQHLAHLKYDERLQAYRWVTDRLPYSFFHTDCESLHETPNTRGQYRLFRFWCLAAASMGVNRLLVSSPTIPSLGRPPRPTWKGRFHWDQIKDEGALQFVEWMNRTLGRPVAESQEAYCALIQSGTPLPEGVSFEKTLAELAPANGEWKPFPKWMRTPLIAYWGRFCDLDLHVPGGSGKAVLKMTAERLGEPSPSCATWEYGDGLYEGRATSRAEGQHSLFFRLDDRFIGPANPVEDVVIKVTFANYQNADGAWRLEYDGANGWTASPEVTLSKSDRRPDASWTATFHLTDARLANRGPDGCDFALRSVSGADVAFQHVRVIKR